MNVWLDDKRPMPAGFQVHCINAHHAAKLITCGLVDMISLDHDLGDENIYGTGLIVAKEIEWLAMKDGPMRRITVYLHTANPVGRDNMKAAIDSAARHSPKVVFGGCRLAGSLDWEDATE